MSTNPQLELSTFPTILLTTVREEDGMVPFLKWIVVLPVAGADAALLGGLQP